MDRQKAFMKIVLILVVLYLIGFGCVKCYEFYHPPTVSQSPQTSPVPAVIKILPCPTIPPAEVNISPGSYGKCIEL